MLFSINSFDEYVHLLNYDKIDRYMLNKIKHEDVERTAIRSASHDEIEEEMERIKSEVTYLRENEIESYRQLFRVPLLRPFLLGIGIQILQQLTGINATIYYVPQIFKQLFTNNRKYI